jgi:hypothetical protein
MGSSRLRRRRSNARPFPSARCVSRFLPTMFAESTEGNGFVALKAVFTGRSKR